MRAALASFTSGISEARSVACEDFYFLYGLKSSGAPKGTLSFARDA
jgi:hypothetical protein